MQPVLDILSWILLLAGSGFMIVSGIVLALALQKNNLLTVELAGLSAYAVVPAIAGMVIGQKVRKALSETVFRKIFFVAIGLLGVLIIAKVGISVKILAGNNTRGGLRK